MTRAAALAALLLALSAPALAQESPAAEAAERRGRTDLGWAAGAEVTFDDNVFLLSEDQKTKLEDGAKGRNRFDDMESVSDVILGAGGRVELEAKAMASRKTSLRLEPEVAVYLRNTRRTHASVRASVLQKLWKGGEASLRASVTPSRYKKNYFAGGADGDGDGDVSGNEKEYEPGVVTETLVTAGLRSKLGRRVELDASAGTASETWAAPLRNRNERALLAGAGLVIEVAKPLDLGLEYDFASARTPSGTEIVLNDKIPSETGVDRSYVSHQVSPRLRIALTRKIDLLARVSLRDKTFLSDGEGDPYRDRKDRRTRAGVALRYGARGLKLEAAYGYDLNRTERPNDPDREDGEALDYTASAIRLGAAVSF